MKRVAFCIALLLIFTGSSVVFAEDSVGSKYSHLSLGFNLNNFHHDFGFGVNLTTPYFLNNRVAVRFSANSSYFEGIPINKTEYDWMPYTSCQLGLIGASAMVNDLIRLYGEGGVIYIIPNRQFSEKNVVGGFGHFGFEFFMNSGSPVCYFIEVGSLGTGAKAERLSEKPIYANGFATSVGLRFHF
ncbi:MAG TPA: hypothetical protein DEB05_04425 [Firmicutes bacterium]|nr:hypothetical protein [Bacillota bacterium]